MKQIVLQLDDERYQVLVEALDCFIRKPEKGAAYMQYPEKERVMAEQLKGLIITQWTGSRYTSQEMEVIEAVKSNVMPVHEYVHDAKAGVCSRCGLSERHNIHLDPVSQEYVRIGKEKMPIRVGKEKQPVNYHRFEPSTKLDGTPDYKRCVICHKGQRAHVHRLDD
jgi:hypothetical protein